MKKLIEKCKCKTVESEIENDEWIQTGKHCVSCRCEVSSDIEPLKEKEND
jgi:hypothetical protein